MTDDDELERIRETMRRAGIDEHRLSHEQLVLTVARLMDGRAGPKGAPPAPPPADDAG